MRREKNIRELRQERYGLKPQNMSHDAVDSLSLQPGGNLQAQFKAGTGLTVTIRRSTNLVDWLPLQTFTNISGLTTFFDSNAVKQVHGFYRAVVP